MIYQPRSNGRSNRSPFNRLSHGPATRAPWDHPHDECIPLSEAVRQAIDANENSSMNADELQLYEHIDPEAIDMLFSDTDGPEITVQINLTNVTVSIWSDRGIDIRVTDTIE